MRRAWLLVLALGCDDAGGDDPLDAAAIVDGAPAEPDAAADGLLPDVVDGLAADAAADAAPDAAIECGELTLEHPIGDWLVATDQEARQWAVSRGGAVLLRSPDCTQPLVDSTAAAPDVTLAFGGFRIDLDELPRATPSGPAMMRVEDDGLSFTWRDQVLRFQGRDGGLEITASAPAEGGAGLYFECAQGEAFMGLGTQVVGLDLRGRAYPLWTQEQGIGKNENGLGFPVSNTIEAAYAPMGVWHSTAGYAAVLAHDHFALLDLCKDGAGSLKTHGGPAGFVLVPGENPKDRMSAISEYVGRPTPPPAWMFAPWNDAVGGPERVAAVAAALRENGIPGSAIWSEDWIGGEQSDVGFRLSYAWEWDPAFYPDLPEIVDGLHEQGFAFLAYFNPFVPEPTRMWAEGIAGDYLVKDAAGEVISFLDPAFRNAGLVDLTNPAALAWLRGYQETAAAEIGADGWMADFAEWLPVEAVMHDGRDGWAAHNDYPLLWQQANRDALSAVHGDDWLYFARSGWASVNGGTGGLAPVLWAGDQDTDWERYDGFPSVFSIGVNAGMAGVPFYGSDIAGYTSELAPNTTKELFYRWSAAGALHPVMRTHHGSDECGNWAFDRDAETLLHYGRWARVHTRLYPYLRQRADEAVMLGWPVVRHPHLVGDGGWWRGQEDLFLLGDDVLVAPVVVEGAAERALAAPAGWLPLFGGPPTTGEPQTFAAPPTELPVFVRPGAILPLLPEAVDSFYGSDQVSDLDDVDHTLLALYPDGDGAVSLTWGEATIAGTGWDAADLPAATFEGEPVDGVIEGPGELSAGPARLTLPAGRWVVALGPDAWGELTQPTPLRDLSPDIPPPCEGE